MADPLAPSLPPASLSTEAGICETETAVLDACATDALPSRLYVAGYGGEVVLYGVSRGETIRNARRLLNQDLPAGEPRWTMAEVALMVRKIRSHKSTRPSL